MRCRPRNTAVVAHSRLENPLKHAAEAAPTSMAAAPPPAMPPPVKSYHEDLSAPMRTSVGDEPKVNVHRAEWRKVISGDPVEIPPSSGCGFRVMSVEEWAGRWRRSDEFPTCLGCNSENTREHAFSQSWCRGQRMWEAESLCLDCHRFSWRHYTDPGWTAPALADKAYWEAAARTLPA